ncbi:C2H2 finger domain-containing protein [Cordyceps fumosorosea ARSEF 2679]|uniref:C2H2 finger domain-containing protein n=1 Tax=Cordyceps fumosorosea (strain ARSEF 2679) TaxID=1081104 RepID=A0A168AR94_CORFA|nr:C2H2 finger domain-containing protein [Cordyceps fumosorosea ARSEF 2679]OAA69087.1 C2H2 finger domain-containing protein [Cordyceps fumosorosea ARSEF 2679]
MASTQPAAGAGAAPSSHPYTCNTCQVAYRNIDLQKAHMKSDWHRYNLKRRVATLPPISAEVFTEKVLQARAVNTAETDKAYFEKSCTACNKTYYSENAYQNHVLSQKHKQNEAAAGPRNEEETKSVISSTFSLGESVPAANNGEVDSDAEDEFNQVIKGLQKAKLSQQRPSPVKRPHNPRPAADAASEDADDAATENGTATGNPQEPVWTLKSCLFCNYESPSVPLNAQHMEKFHGMFIPEKPYLTDLDGLLQQLQSKIGQGHACLFCDKIKNSVYAVQTHMRDTGHCKIPYSTEEEQLDIGDFYDFRSTYSDPEGSDSDEEMAEGDAGGARVYKAKADRDGEKEDEDGDGWETDSSVSSLDSEDLTAVPAEGHFHQYDRLSKHPHHAHDDPRPRHQADGWHSRAHKHTHAVFYDDYELHLPSGKSVGHRSLNKYFRQNLTNYPTAEERTERLAIEGSERPGSDDEGDRRVARRDRSRGRAVVPRGAAGLMGASDDAKKEVRKDEKRARKLENFQTKKRSLKYGENNNNQKHYYYRYDGGG